MWLFANFPNRRITTYFVLITIHLITVLLSLLQYWCNISSSFDNPPSIGAECHLQVNIHDNLKSLPYSSWAQSVTAWLEFHLPPILRHCIFSVQSQNSVCPSSCPVSIVFWLHMPPQCTRCRPARPSSSYIHCSTQWSSSCRHRTPGKPSAVLFIIFIHTKPTRLSVDFSTHLLSGAFSKKIT